MVDPQWLQTLGKLTAELVTVEYNEQPDDAHLLALLKQAHVMYVQVHQQVDTSAGSTRDDGVCTGPCVYMSSKPNKEIRALVMSIRKNQEKEKNYARLLELVGHGDLPVCAVTGLPCQRNTEQRVSAQLLHEAKQVLQYAQELVKSRVLELEALEDLKTSLQGGAATQTLVQQFNSGGGTNLISTLFTCIPCDAAMRAQVLSNASSVDAVLRPLTRALPPRMQHQAPLVKHAFAKRWSSACIA